MNLETNSLGFNKKPSVRNYRSGSNVWRCRLVNCCWDDETRRL